MIESIRNRAAKPGQRGAVLAAVIVVLSLSSCSTSLPFVAAARGPHQSLTPQDVVEIQIAFLSDSRDPDNGEAAAYRFQSPDAPGAWAGSAGSSAQYRARLDDPAFRPLRTAFEARYKPIIQMGHIAIQRVRVSSTEGVDGIYDFRLRRQENGDCGDCWMVLSIRPVQIIPRDDTRPRYAVA